MIGVRINIFSTITNAIVYLLSTGNTYLVTHRLMKHVLGCGLIQQAVELPILCRIQSFSFNNMYYIFYIYTKVTFGYATHLTGHTGSMLASKEQMFHTGSMFASKDVSHRFNVR